MAHKLFNGITICFNVAAFLIVPTVHARTIFLNGQDISSAYGERLKDVDIYIDKNGDLFISGPQYKVILESTRSPLSLAPRRQTQDSSESAADLHQRMQQEASSRSQDSSDPLPAPQGERVRGVNEPASEDLPEMIAK